MPSFIDLIPLCRIWRLANSRPSPIYSFGSDLSLTFIDLFAGIGGTRLAFEESGMECVFSSEWNVHAQYVYEANFLDRPHGDITAINASSIPKFDILVAGFPCQPFSSIGLGQGFAHKTQGTLFFDI